MKKWWKNIKNNYKSTLAIIGLISMALALLALFNVNTRAVPGEVGGSSNGDSYTESLKNQCAEKEGYRWDSSAMGGQGNCVPNDGSENNNDDGGHMLEHDSSNPGATPDCPAGTYVDGINCVPIPDCEEGEYFSISDKRCVNPQYDRPATGGDSSEPGQVGQDKATRKQDCARYGYDWDDSGDGSCDTPETAKSEEACKEWAKRYNREFGSGLGVEWIDTITLCVDNAATKQDTDSADNEDECVARGGEWINNDCLPTSLYDSITNESDCNKVGGVWDENDEDGDGQKCSPPASTSDDSEDPCEAGFLGFGWLFCPGANLIDSFLNGFLNWIDSQLNWTMLAENDTVIRERWQNFLNIANIAFAIAFLVMIYSMATSTGLSNYDIKKMLPRLIVVAIAVNLSFYICAAIVDIFNIIGNGIFGIINPDGDTWSVSVGTDGFVGFGTTIVAIIGVVFIFGISAVVALAIIFICLCVREIALIALVVISPVAFVCYLLPNTQKWFQRWADYFIQLLVIYPMFMAVWGAAKWVASLKGSAPPSKDAMPGFVVSLTCMIAPAIAIVPLFKMSGGIMGMAASKAASSKLAAKGQAAQGYMRNRGKQAYHNSMIGRGIDRHRDRVKNLDKQVNEGSYAGYNPWRRARQAFNRGINKIPVIGGAKGVSSDKDLGNFLKNYTYVDGYGNVQHLTDDQMLDYIQGRAAEDNNGNVILAAQNLNAEQIGSGIKALGNNALEDVSGKTTTGGAPVAATDASKRYAHLQATSYMHEMYAKHGIDIGKGDPSDAYKQLSDLATSGSYVDKSGTKHTFGSHSPVRSDAAEMKRRFDANAGSADAEKIFNEEAKSFQTKRQSSAIKTTISGFTDAAAKRESDEISKALGSAMKAREFKKNAFKSGASTPPSS